MSVDRTLKSRSALVRHRNVLTRTERIEVLADEGKWTEGQDSVFGLPKVVHRKSHAGKKVKKTKETATTEETATAEPEAGASS